MRLLPLVALLALVYGQWLRAEDHIWSQEGKEIFLVVGNEGIGHVKPVSAHSPDGKKRIQIDFKRSGQEGDAIPVATLVTGHRTIPIKLDKNWAQVEVLWSPDSASVALSGAFNAYTNSTKIFRLTENGIDSVELQSIRSDMARTYPPCRAMNTAEDDCKRDATGKYFNYATVAWADPTTAVIMAEVPCSSSHGGIMCQVKGYEVDTGSAKITRTMTAQQLKTRWQRRLAWNLTIPDAPMWKK